MRRNAFKPLGGAADRQPRALPVVEATTEFDGPILFPDGPFHDININELLNKHSDDTEYLTKEKNINKHYEFIEKKSEYTKKHSWEKEESIIDKHSEFFKEVNKIYNHYKHFIPNKEDNDTKYEIHPDLLNSAKTVYQNMIIDNKKKYAIKEKSLEDVVMGKYL